MEIVGWLVWGFAVLILIIQIPLSFNRDSGIGRLATRFSLFIVVGLIGTVFLNISKLHLLWWLPFTYFLNFALFKWSANRQVTKSMREILNQHPKAEGISSSKSLATHSELPLGKRNNMATMTLSEAEKILDIVSIALQDTSHRHYAVSALKGYDIYQICTALKLRIANEFLHLAHRADFDEQFAEGLRLYDGIPFQITSFVRDDEIDSINAVGVFELIDPSTMTIKDEIFASEETGASFGDYCKSVGSKDKLYWQKIYTRLGLEYTSSSPKENDPV